MRIHSEVHLDVADKDHLTVISVFNYFGIPDRFRLGTSADDIVTVYKGAQRGRERVGFFSHTAEEQQIHRIENARNIVEGGDEEAIRDVFDSHTSANPYSAFLSTSSNPEAAQVFAPTGGNGFTIYKIELPANRCVLDAFNTGNAGASGEVLVLGLIHPGEITAYKLRNEDSDSELVYTDPQGVKLIRYSQDPHSLNRKVKDPGNWVYLANHRTKTAV